MRKTPQEIEPCDFGVPKIRDLSCHSSTQRIQLTEYLPKSSSFIKSVSPPEIWDNDDSFPTRNLRPSQPLSLLINKSLENGVYPSKLNLAKVIPIYKIDHESDPSNYRLLSVFNIIVFLRKMKKEGRFPFIGTPCV